METGHYNLDQTKRGISTAEVPLLPEAPPMDIGSIQATYRYMRGVKLEHVQRFVNVRRDGASDDLFANVHSEQLADWHVTEGHFVSEASKVFYQGGLLYGFMMNDNHYRLSDEKLVADDWIALQAGLQAVRRSYEDDEEVVRWKQERDRELLYLGSSNLAIVNAALQEQIRGQYQQAYGDTPLPEGKSLEAVYTGLIDATIFVDAFQRNKHGLPPRKFKDELAIANYEMRMPRKGPPVSMLLHKEHPIQADQMSVSGVKDIGFLIEQMKPDPAFAKWYGFDFANNHYRALAAQKLRQTGPNEFTPAYHIYACYGSNRSLDLRRTIGKMSRWALYATTWVSSLSTIGDALAGRQAWESLNQFVYEATMPAQFIGATAAIGIVEYKRARRLRARGAKEEDVKQDIVAESENSLQGQ